MPGRFDGFDDFFPWYVGQHSRRPTRWFHFVGTHLGAATALTGIVTRRPALLAGMPLISYSVAWFSHFVIEKNNPASFGHPLWSLRGDIRMLAMMWQGRDGELDAIARQALRPPRAA
ncbi:MAG: DUF962 domain-containing protein [Candidatus Dormibacteraeota bacterium]|uniref:DUF962 domain-containing protein n=1 Tax=Candidatus Amunia macphersoniae TaxID=3127014 RepID=A0A934KDP5_9BACT|nr:DUF962 domain-containing protein [Candidatus Dormibacteraeota bacterium]